MDLVTSKLIALCVIILYTEVILCSEFIGSCNTTSSFSHDVTSFLLNYDRASLNDTYGKPCEAVVDINTLYFKTNICVKLYSEHDNCTRFLKFYYAEDLNQYYSCEEIQHKLVCKQSGTVFAEFQPWNKTAEYSGNMIIYVYEETYIETPPDSKSDASDEYLSVPSFLAIIVGCIVVVIICCCSCKKSFDENNRRQAVNQRPRLTRFHSNESSQGNQSHSLSAEPPNYTDVMAVENRQNNVNSTSAPSQSEDTIPETPPPPYPECLQYV